ncbi:MAG TPA: alpha/beta hydrolase [Spirochaetota bacterium]|nr:alpha/beta hydrolase [Spirochaetota bacterium]
MFIENFKFRNSRGIELAGRLYRKNKDQKAGVIFSHGLFSSKDGYKITRMAETIVESGYTLLTFDFTFSGESSGSIKDISISEEVEDLKCAVNFFKSKGIEKIHLMGSSMGAAVTILVSSLDLFDIESLILIAAPLSFEKLVPEIKKDEVKSLDPDGYTSIQGVMVNNRFIKEIFETEMVEAVKRIKIPTFIVHGKMDAIVDFGNLEVYIKNCGSECTSLVIDDGDHNLTRDSDISIISEKVKEWLGKFNV